MRPLRYSINLTLDGCYDHRVGVPDAESHRHATEIIAQADALILGRITYQLMESAWRAVGEGREKPDWLDDWMEPFAHSIHAAKKYVVSDSLPKADWNAELIRGGELKRTVERLKQQPGRGLYVGGVKLPLALAEMGLIDEYQFIVAPRIVGHGPTLFSGLSKYIDLRLVGRQEFGSGAVVLRYEPKR